MQAGKRCLVFGVASARSIAWGIASNWASQGAHVIVVCQSMRLLPSISSLIAAHPHAQNMIAAPPCDVTIDSDIEKVADFAQHFHKVKRGRALDAIVHSVAFAPSEAMKGRLVDVTSHDFAQALHISSYSLISISKKFTPLLASEPLLDAQGRTQQHNTSTSSITTLSFLGSQRVVPQYSVMGPAKAALEAIARGVAVDLAPSGIRCNVLSPGPIHTLAIRGIQDFRSLMEAYKTKAPLKRDVGVNECASAASYLAFAEGITGQVLHVDAGYSIML